MADEIEEIEYGVKVNWSDFKQGIGVATQAIHKFFADLSDAMMKDGKSADEILARIKSHLANFRDSGALLGRKGIDFNAMSPDAFEKFIKQGNSAYDKELGHQYKRLYRGDFNPKPPPTEDFAAQWNKTAMAVVRFRATLHSLERPFNQIYGFVDGLKQANLQFSLLSQKALTTASSLAGGGGAFAAFGGSIASYANFRSSFATEMEKRRIGLGNGGQFTQAMMHYGIQFDPRSFDRTMQNIVAFMSSGSRSDSQKLMAGRMLGMDDAMIAAAKRGSAFYNDYQRTIKSMSSNQDEAAQKSQELSLETYKLHTAFNDLKNGIFNDLQPVIKGIVKVLTPIIELLNNKFIRVVVEIIGGLILAAVTIGKLRLLGGAFKGLLTVLGKVIPGLGNFAKLLAGLKTAQAASTTASTMSTIAQGGARASQTAGSLGRIGGSIGGAGGSLAGGGLGAILGMLTGVVQVFQSKLILDSLTDIIKIIARWQVMWMEWCKAETGYFNKGRDEGKMKSLGIGGEFLNALERKQLVSLGQQKALIRSDEYYKQAQKRGTAGNGITVEHLSVSVQTQATNPQEIANIVHNTLIDEFKVLDNGKVNET